MEGRRAEAAKLAIGLVERGEMSVKQAYLEVFPLLLSPQLWREVGADASRADAAEALVVAGQLLRLGDR